MTSLPSSLVIINSLQRLLPRSKAKRIQQIFATSFVVVLGHSSNGYISGHLFGHIADDANYSHAIESSISRSNFVEQYLNLSCATQGVPPLHCVPRLLNSTQICEKPYNDTLVNLTLTYGCATSIIVKVYESNNVNMSFAMAENIYRFYNPKNENSIFESSRHSYSSMSMQDLVLQKACKT